MKNTISYFIYDFFDVNTIGGIWLSMINAIKHQTFFYYVRNYLYFSQGIRAHTLNQMYLLRKNHCKTIKAML
jgi:hypothetical protein